MPATAAPRKTTRTVKKKTSSSLTGQALRLAIRSFLGLKSQSETIKKQMDEAKKILSATVEEQGYEDDKGHFILELDEPVDGCVALKREKRVTQSLDEEAAEKILRRKGIYEECVETIVVIDPDLVTKAFYQGKISEAELDKMFSTKTIWAFVPKMEKGR